jgi:hypothetical protein
MKKWAAFVDVLFLLLLMLLVLPHQPETKSDDTPPGQIIVEAIWGPSLNIDVDLWVLAPDDRPVGYSNRAGDYFNLLRDDLGSMRDTLPLNYETSYTRGAPPGEYTVGVHLYNNFEKTYPVEVTVRVTTRIRGVTGHIFTRTVSLLSYGQEITVNRFSLDEDSQLIAGSIHDIPRSLRTAFEAYR